MNLPYNLNGHCETSDLMMHDLHSSIAKVIRRTGNYPHSTVAHAQDYVYTNQDLQARHSGYAGKANSLHIAKDSSTASMVSAMGADKAPHFVATMAQT